MHNKGDILNIIHPKTVKTVNFTLCMFWHKFKLKNIFKNIHSKLYNEILKYLELLIMPMKTILLIKFILFFSFYHVVTF